MEFYLFDLEKGFPHFALIYANSKEDATQLYKRYVVDVENMEDMSPKVIHNSMAVELMTFESNLSDKDLDEIIEEIKGAQHTKRAVLVLVDSRLV